MKEFIEKLIDRLEELKSLVPVNRVLDNIIESKPKELGQLIAYEKSIKAVNELAEEYINTSTDTSSDTSTTNADRIRSMNDEELAEFLYDTNHYFENGEYLVRFGGEIVQDEEINILDWLKSEVEGVTENE